jgi:hypothetical protein
MAFSFGFSGDDIEEDPNDVQEQGQQQATADSNVPPPIAAKTHDLDELVSPYLWYSCRVDMDTCFFTPSSCKVVSVY